MGAAGQYLFFLFTARIRSLLHRMDLSNTVHAVPINEDLWASEPAICGFVADSQFFLLYCWKLGGYMN